MKKKLSKSKRQNIFKNDIIFDTNNEQNKSLSSSFNKQLNRSIKFKEAKKKNDLLNNMLIVSCHCQCWMVSKLNNF